MAAFDLGSCLDCLHATPPATDHRPVVGLTGNFSDIDVTLRAVYHQQIVAAGGVPVLIPPVAEPRIIVDTLDRIDALVFTGGGDHNPLWYGEEPSPRLHHINKERDEAELVMARLAYQRQIPILGICRGIQTLAIALGGKVAQDIQVSVKHDQDADRSEPTHTVQLMDGSVLRDLYQRENIFVNSFHHQAVSDPGSCFRVAAKALDGTIEAMESQDGKSIMGVQWHPEWLGEDGQPLFRWLVERAREFAQAKELHRQVLTLDSHCDTPMFFPQGIHFERRDTRVLVDLHKMTEGKLDAVTMVAYLPQPKEGERFADKVDYRKINGGEKYADGISPKAYADLIFDEIERVTSAYPDHVGIARTPAELYANKRRGRKSVMLGIENGLALEGSLSNIAHFARRGIVYITLCHNGDNDICDSARGEKTHRGLSDFGTRVVKEMNRQGIMVDLSHASEESFFDAMRVSELPIVCSHSNCKSLCDVPRNLSDEQLRALAKSGGVAQTTLYHGFLRQNGTATIEDAVAHLEHAVQVMGIEHVGLGTDFDGDGGVSGFADASEAINFTIRLLRKRYSERDIALIWGGNWLRVMEQVQNKRNQQPR